MASDPELNDQSKEPRDEDSETVEPRDEDSETVEPRDEDSETVEPRDGALAGADDVGGRSHLVFLILAFATVIAVLLVVLKTQAWDGYVCETDEDCRGLKVCREGSCVSPEIWQRQHFEGASTAE